MEFQTVGRTNVLRFVIDVLDLAVDRRITAPLPLRHGLRRTVQIVSGVLKMSKIFF